MSIILHGGPAAGRSHTLTKPEERAGVILIPAPLDRFPKRKARYARRTLTAGARTWQEWHFIHYKLGKRSG